MQSSRHSIMRVTRALFAASVASARTQSQITQRAASLPPRGSLPLPRRSALNPRAIVAALFHSHIPSHSSAALKYSPRSALPTPVAPATSVSVTGAGVIMVEHSAEGANVVLFRRRNNDCWEEPGGFLEPPCADPLGSALRELYEESCTLVRLDAASLAQSPGPAKYNGVPAEPTLLPLSLDVRGRSQATRYRCFFLSVPRNTAPSSDQFATTRALLEQSNSAASLLETTGIVRVPLINFARALADIECNLDSVIVSSPAQPSPELHSPAPAPLSSRPPAPVTAAFFPSERTQEPDTTFSGPGTFVEDEDGVQRRISPRTLKIFACGGMTLLEHLLPFNG